jgi:hypothetical protein
MPVQICEWRCMQGHIICAYPYDAAEGADAVEGSLFARSVREEWPDACQVCGERTREFIHRDTSYRTRGEAVQHILFDLPHQQSL